MMTIVFYKGPNDAAQANSSHLKPGTIWYFELKQKQQQQKNNKPKPKQLTAFFLFPPFS